MEKKIIPCPIIVNEYMQIIDGQGRFTVLKELHQPIQYIIYKGGTIEDCRIMNNAMTNWTANDYIESYAKEGDENYLLLKKAIDDTNMPVQAIMAAVGKGDATISGGKYRKRMNSKVNNGEAEFTSADYYQSVKICNMVKEMWEALARTDRLTQKFREAAIPVIRTPGYDHDRMITALRKHRYDFELYGKVIDQQREFSRVYNYGRQKNKIMFEDFHGTRRGRPTRTVG